jgi:hypothetical protein
MTFLLSSQNVFEYLIEQRFCTSQEQNISQIKSKSCKNFNLLLSLANNRHLLIKQERYDSDGNTKGEFFNEWIIQELLQNFPELRHLRTLISEVIHFDPARAIIVFNYLNDYCDLSDFYSEKQIFPTKIAASIGASIAVIHRATLDNQKYKNFFEQNYSEDLPIDYVPNLLYGLEPIGPEIFSQVSLDNLKFFELYQRYQSLGQAIAELNTAFEPCCLIHNDLKLNNILLHIEWEQILSTASPSTNSIVRLIDWENWAWGDPAYDLGTIIANYLKIWLNSLIISTDIDVDTALRLAITPLESLQPSIVALTKAYFENFPEILVRRPDFLKRVVQFTGFGLIEKIQARIEYQEPFGNIGICMLQVAKTLLCRPEESIEIIFGTTASELTNLTCLST